MEEDERGPLPLTPRGLSIGETSVGLVTEPREAALAVRKELVPAAADASAVVAAALDPIAWSPDLAGAEVVTPALMGSSTARPTKDDDEPVLRADNGVLGDPTVVVVADCILVVAAAAASVETEGNGSIGGRTGAFRSAGRA